MSWTRALPASLAVCALLAGATGCGSGASGGARGAEEVRPSPVGKVLQDTDEEGRHYREIDERDAPDVAVEIQPDTEEGDGEGDGWDVRLTVHGFRFSPAGTHKKAEPGRGYALLRLDDRPLSVLRRATHRLRGDVVPRGTHQVTVRLHADDDTVWAVDGEPVGSTADITVSGPNPAHGERTTAGPPPSASADGGPGLSVARSGRHGFLPRRSAARPVPPRRPVARRPLSR